MIEVNAGAKMKFKVIVVALVVSLVIISSFTCVVTASSDEGSEPDGTSHNDIVSAVDGGDSGAEPCDGGDDRGGPNPW